MQFGMKGLKNLSLARQPDNDEYTAGERDAPTNE